MNDEIKEIELDHFNSIKELKQNVETWIKEEEMYWERWFSLYDLKTLLDYITNLQTKNEYLETWNSEIKLQLDNLQQENETRQQDINNLTYQLAKIKEENERLNDKIEFYEDVDSDRCAYNEELQKENERLKELCDKYEEEHSNEFKIWKEERHELLDYKSRCEKAIKYIDTNFCIENRRDLKEVVNILQNGSDDNE